MNFDYDFSALVTPTPLPPSSASSIDTVVVDNNYIDDTDGACSLLADSIARIAHEFDAISLNDSPSSFTSLTNTSSDHSPGNTSSDSVVHSSLSSPYANFSSPDPSSSPPSTFQHHSSTASSPNCDSSSTKPDDLQCIRINGRKVFGPPGDWSGPPPPIAAEVFVKRIPRHMKEQHLHALFRRFGPIYCVRLMVDFNDENRGFGYVHYASVTSADRALYVLQHLYVQPHVQLHLERSYDKCRLFVSHLPKNLRVNSIRVGLHAAFPEVQTVTVYHAQGSQPASGNRGFAFMDFPTHDAAIRAKQQASTGRVRLFGQDVQIVWANPERSVPMETMKDLRTLFVRNVDMELRQADLFAIIVKFVLPEEVRKVSRNRDLAFIEMRSRASAERVMDGLQGYIGLKRQFEVKWSIPPVQNSLHSNLKTPPDHDATLRLMCVANEWLVPVYLFGRIFTQTMSQYVCVVLAAANGTTGAVEQRCALIMEVRLTGADMQSRAAEVALSVVRRCGRLPPVNYVMVVERDAYHIVGCIADLEAGIFQRAASTPGPVDQVVALFWAELETLALCADRLLKLSRPQLRQRYDEVVCMSCIAPYGYLPDLVVQGRVFGCINPGYRRQPPLAHDCDMGQLVLVACDVHTGRNYNLSGQAANKAYALPLDAAGGETTLRYERVPLEEVVAPMSSGTGELEGVGGGIELMMGEHFVVFFGHAPNAVAMTAAAVDADQ